MRYEIKGAMIIDNENEYTYNLTNKHDAEKLYTQLTAYEEKLELYQNITKTIEQLSYNLIDAQRAIITLQVNVDDLKRD